LTKTYSDEKLLIFLPTLNEELNVVPLIVEIANIFPNANYLIIDDNSTDKTVENLLSLNFSKLKIIVRKNAFGIGSAHKDALMFAIRNDYSILVSMDSDGTHRPADIPLLLDKVNTCDIVIGSRFLAKKSIIDWSLGRRFLTYAGHLVTKFGLDLDFDCSSGMRAYNLSKQDFGVVESIDANDYDFFYKTIFLFHKKFQMNIQEVSLKLLPRFSGDSKLTVFLVIKSVLNLVSDILKFRKDSFFNLN
jgi:dolichol-phosphate mannosyltransferase